MRFRRLSIRYHELSPGAALRLFGDPWILPLPIPMARPEWRPPVDYWEIGDELKVKIEVAGMTEDQFEILVYQDVLVIQGERPWRSSGAEARFHLAEIRYGPFRFELPIPGNVDRDRVSARYEQGFLTVHLPKADASG